MYREVILDHYKNPRNNEALVNPDIKKRDENPLCGDVIEYHLNLKNGKVSKASFTGKGCAICIASSSILSEELQGKNLEEVENITREDMLDLVGVSLTPSRVKCAMLPLITVKKGISEYKGDGK